MKLIVEEKNGCAEKVIIEYTTTEALTLNHAMRRYVTDEDVGEINRAIMKRMLEVEPIFKDVAGSRIDEVRNETNNCNTNTNMDMVLDNH